MSKLAENYLKQALSLAGLRRGFCAPNPCVGAILVKDEKPIASGYHWTNGSPHAEADVLNKVDTQLARGATLYITLQPCCHNTKKTPPCDQLLIEKGIAKVIYGFRDPNPAVAKESNARLLHAGVACTHFAVPEIDHFYSSYQFWWQHERPFVTAKLAMSLDGKIAGKHGKRVKLTGKLAQHFTHQHRLHTDAILTTAKTIYHDNPLLNARVSGTVIAKPLIILDSTLSLSGTENVFHSANNITLFHKPDLPAKDLKKYSQTRVRLVPVRQNDNDTGLNWFDILKQLGQDGCHDLWIEAGGRCVQTLIQNQLLQRAFIYVAPRWLGQDAQAAFDHPDLLLGANANAPYFLGQDVCFQFNWIDNCDYNGAAPYSHNNLINKQYNTLHDKHFCLP